MQLDLAFLVAHRHDRVFEIHQVFVLHLEQFEPHFFGLVFVVIAHHYKVAHGSTSGFDREWSDKFRTMLPEGLEATDARSSGAVSWKTPPTFLITIALARGPASAISRRSG